MLTPEQIKEASSSMTDLMQNLEEFVIKDITRRLKKALDATPTAEIQTAQAINYGISTDKIQQAYTSVFGKADKRLKTIIESAGRLNVEQENERLEKAGYSVSLTPALKGLINDISKQTRGLFKNLSNTSAIGFTKQTKSGSKFLGTSAFITDALDDAIMKLRTGVQSPAEALRDAIKTMGDSGLTVKFKSGYKCNIESAYKRAIKTGVNQLSSIQNAEIADELDLPLAEVTAHAGARPDHKKWQGKVYQIHGSSKKYKNLAKETGLGRVDGLLGANCRHQWYGYAEGAPRTYAPEELKYIDPPPVNYNGKRYTHYEIIQKQRQIESKINASKRMLVGYQESLDEERIAYEKSKLKELKSEYKNICGIVSLPRIISTESGIIIKDFDELPNETYDEMAIAMKEDGFLAVSIHCNGRNFGIRDNRGKTIMTFTPERLCYIINSRKRNSGIDKVKIYSCNSGAKGSTAAQKLANLLNTEVKAPIGYCIYTSNGFFGDFKITSEIIDDLEKDRDKIYKGESGWRIFKPKNTL